MINDTTPLTNETSAINVSGNIVPTEWYGAIRTQVGKSNNTKPDLLAILILADIRYWYTNTVTRDESTGEIVKISKKFKADLLQKSYGSYATQFGVNKKAVIKSMKNLSNLGFINLYFRTIRVLDGSLSNNVLFIEINPSKIRTLPPNWGGPIPQIGGEGIPQIGGEGIPQIGVTYTESTTKTTTQTTQTKGNFDKFPLECSNLETAKVAGSQGNMAPTKKTAAPKFKQTAKSIGNIAQNKLHAPVKQVGNTSPKAKLPSAKNPKTRELIEHAYSVAPQTWRFVSTGNNRDTYVLQRLLTSGRFTVEQLKAMIDLAVKWQPRTQANEYKPEIFDFAKLEVQASKIFSSLPASIRLSGQPVTVASSPPAVYVDRQRDAKFAEDKSMLDSMLDRWETRDKEFGGMRWNYRMSISQARDLVAEDCAKGSWYFQEIIEDFENYGNDWLHNPDISIKTAREQLLRKLNWQVVSEFCNAPNAVDEHIREYLDLVVPKFIEITQPDVMLNKLGRLTTVTSLPKDQYWIFDLWEYGKWKDYIVELIEKHNVPRFKPVHYTEIHAAFMAELEKEYDNV